MKAHAKRHQTADLHDVEASETHLEALANHVMHLTVRLGLDHAHTEDHAVRGILLFLHRRCHLKKSTTET